MGDDHNRSTAVDKPRPYDPVRITGRISTTYLTAGQSVEVAYTPLIRDLHHAGWIIVDKAV